MGAMRHPLTMEPRPRLWPGLLRANFDPTCQNRVTVVKKIGWGKREHRPGRLIRKRLGVDQYDRTL